MLSIEMNRGSRPSEKRDIVDVHDAELIALLAGQMPLAREPLPIGTILVRSPGRRRRMACPGTLPHRLLSGLFRGAVADVLGVLAFHALSTQDQGLNHQTYQVGRLWLEALFRGSLRVTNPGESPQLKTWKGTSSNWLAYGPWMAGSLYFPSRVVLTDCQPEHADGSWKWFRRRSAIQGDWFVAAPLFEKLTGEVHDKSGREARSYLSGVAALEDLSAASLRYAQSSACV